MPWLIKEQRRWLKRHGQRNGSGWVCKKTGEPINGKPFDYLIHGFTPGGPCPDQAVHPQDRGGDNYRVIAMWCTSCGEEPDTKPQLSIPYDIVEVFD